MAARKKLPFGACLPDGKGATPVAAAAKPAAKGKRYQIMDAQVPGFGIRVTDTGNRTFILRTRYPGSVNPSRREIGQCADLTLTQRHQQSGQLQRQSVEDQQYRKQRRIVTVRARLLFRSIRFVQPKVVARSVKKGVRKRTLTRKVVHVYAVYLAESVCK